ncbi:heterokaryon incompatibility protein-domain-containing protein [Bisporella sp. PMI_857]|nr:heterokaryon incompatibility protein-domain-containing protein [Bisporella sp. PMI_857]
MGYSQLWTIKSRAKWLAVWPRLVADTRTILDAADIDLTSDRIWDMMEVQSCYGGSDEAVRKLRDPPPPIVDEETGIIFNGIHNDGCEPFVLEPFPQPPYETEKLTFSCKTNRRPYDTVVCAVLTRAKQLLRDAFYAGLPTKSQADDEDDGWARAFSMIALLWPEDDIPEEADESWEDWERNAEETECMDSKQPTIKSPLNRGSEGRNLGRPQNGDMGDTLQKQLLPLEFSGNPWSTILHWIQHCDINDAGHETCHATRPLRHLPLMRLIDVQRGCIVPAQPNTIYVALSYVWGSPPQSSLLSSNFVQLHEDDGFRKHGIRLSKTISDSIALCQRLGYRYLWVDAYCILQDNPHDKVLQLNTMRYVYSNAIITIVAANGTHANSGLGVPGREIAPLAMKENSNIWASFTQALSKTVWDTRGWTFQEKVLSRRLILFSHDGPFFLCGARAYSEHGFQQLQNNVGGFLYRPGCFYNMLSGTQLELYLATVQHYSARKLTVETDFENAMKGVLKAFGHSIDGRPNSFFQGIPTTFFDDLFCWKVAEHIPKARRCGFPSWSWQGWRQTPIFPHQIMDRVNFKRKNDLWGSRILAYDRGNFKKITNVDSFGLNTSGPNPLMLSWSGAPLEVEMKSSEDVGSTNGLFRVFLPANGRVAGQIQLHKQWRARQPAMMEFLPIFTEELNGKAKIKVLMCLEHSHQDLRGVGGPSDSFERVQLMDCDIEETDWIFKENTMDFGDKPVCMKPTRWIY